MLIKEGSKLKIIECNNLSSPLIDEIIACQDIEIEGNGNGYCILLRNKGYDTNNIFESEAIIEEEDGSFKILGYFKDALLVIENKNYAPAMYSSYMND